MDARTVLKLVSMPPSQRWSTYGMPHRIASRRITSWAARLVPTKSTVPLLAAMRPRKLIASR